jgi:hypothetical protein
LFLPLSHILACFSLQKWLPIFPVTQVVKNKNGVMKMEVKLKDRLVGNGLAGIMKNVGAIYRRIAKISAKGAEVDVIGVAPYEASRECQAHVAEIECQRSQSLAEARKNLLRC